MKVLQDFVNGKVELPMGAQLSSHANLTKFKIFIVFFMHRRVHKENKTSRIIFFQQKLKYI